MCLVLVVISSGKSTRLGLKTLISGQEDINSNTPGIFTVAKRFFNKYKADSILSPLSLVTKILKHCCDCALQVIQF